MIEFLLMAAWGVSGFLVGVYWNQRRAEKSLQIIQDVFDERLADLEKQKEKLAERELKAAVLEMDYILNWVPDSKRKEIRH